MQLVLAFLLLSLAPAGAGPNPATPERPNVLFVMADDLNTNLGSYGHPTARTPHLDALAKRGVRFAQAYVQFPHCNPSRASLLTGQRPDTTRVYDLVANFRTALPEAVTLPQHFRAHGYRTVRVGKIFHQGVPTDIGKAGMDDPPSWTDTINPDGRDRTFKGQKPLDSAGRGGGFAWGALDPDEDHADHGVATAAIAQLEKHGSGATPLFLAVGFYRPHVPLPAPQRYLDMHPPARLRFLPEPPVPAAELPAPPARNGGVPSYLYEPTPEQRRQVAAAYDATVSFMDAQVGRIVEALDRLGQTRRTIVVFTSDHGWHLGEHGLWAKRSLFAESARVPLIVTGPGTRGRGVAKSVVELIDLYPTLADLAGLPPPAGLPGKSLRPLLERPSRVVDGVAFTQALRGRHMGRSIRTARYRYSEWDGGQAGVELYDFVRDPRELRNRAQDPKLAKVREELRDRLHRALPVPPGT